MGKPPVRKLKVRCKICGEVVVDPPTSLNKHKAEVHKDPDAIALEEDLESW